MNRAPRTRRLFTGAAALSIGLFSGVVMGAPATASTLNTVSVHGEAACDATSGNWVITWTVVNDQPDQVGTIRSVTVTPDADISPITLGASVPGSHDGSLTATQQVVPGDAAEATLRITVTWGRAAPPSHADDTVDLSGECTVPTSPSPEPPASPSPPAASPSPEPSYSPTPTELPSSPTPTEPLPSSTPTEDEGQGGELPTTGTSTWLIAGGAIALLALGAGLFLVARRRRITFTA